MRIIFVSQLFDPENSIKGLDFARRLVSLGHEVEVITTFPSYPGGKIYSGYHQKFRSIEIADGVKIIRVPTYINHGTSSLKRILSYFSFGVMGGAQVVFSRKKADIIYAYYPPVIVGLMATIVGLIRKIPYVYDVQDLWPEALVATGNIQSGSKIERLVEKLCGVVYRRAAAVVVLSDGYRQALIAKGVEAQRVTRIFNWCDESRVKIKNSYEERVCFEKGEFFNVLYAGNLGTAQALEHVVEAARIIQLKGNDSVRFLFLGTGVTENRLKADVEKFGLSNVQFLPRVSADEVGEYLSAADALLVHLADDPVFEITIPQKTQAYLMAGRPIIMAVRGEAAEIIQESGAGVVVEPCNSQELADTVLRMSELSSELLRKMADNGADFYHQHMSMENGVAAVDRLLKEIVNKSNNYER